MKGVYSHNVNEDIIIAEGKAIIDPIKSKIETTGKIIFKILPYPRIRVELVLSEKRFDSEILYKLFDNKKGKEKYVSIKFESLPLEIGVSIKSVIFKIRNRYDSDTEIVGFPQNDIFIGNPEKRVKRIILYILNFPQFIRQKGVSNKTKQKKYGSLELRNEDWKLMIAEVDDLRKKINFLKEKGGYVITHIGELTKHNYISYRYNDKVKDFIELVSSYLSFCRGLFTAPILLVGEDESGNKVFERWIQSKIDAWKESINWFMLHYEDSLREVFPGFSKLWKDDIWRTTIKNTIHWYILSNNIQSISLEGAIALSQVALELLSWTFLVMKKKCITGEGFGNLSATDKINLLLSIMEIHSEVPQELSGLKKISKEYNWNGPQAITEIRNFIVHPGTAGTRIRKRRRELPLLDVWNLSLYYIESILLRLCNYQGNYFNRALSKFVELTQVKG